MLFAKRPEPLSGAMAARIFWSPLVYGLAGLALGVVVGLVAAALLSCRTRRVTPDAERSSVWSLTLPAILGLFWVYAANRLYPGDSRAATALILDGAVLVASLVLTVVLWSRTVTRAAPFRERALLTAVLVVVIWLPLYALSGTPSLEQTRVAREDAGAPEAPDGSPNLILIMTDTFRTDCLSCYGPTEFDTPAIDRLASEGALFEQAVTPEPLTRPAVCTLFTGLHPRTHGVDSNTKRLGDDFVTLAETLRSGGYRTAAFTAATVLSGAYGTAQGFDYYSEPSEPWWYLRPDTALRRLYISLSSWRSWWIEIPATEVNRRAMAWLDANGDRPFFMFVHYFDAHAPYAPPAEFDLAAREGLDRVPRPYEDEQVRFSPGFEMPEDFLRQQWLRYRGEIAFVDSSLSEFLGHLRESGILDETVVALVGDHGESFEHHAWFSHGTRLYDTQVHVPMIIRGPGVPAGVRVTDQVRLLDVYPTLLSLVGGEVSGPVQGVDLSRRNGWPGARGVVSPAGAVAARAGDLPAFCQTDLGDRRPLSSRVSFALRLPPWKVIVSPEMGLTELYDVASDPGETLDVAPLNPATVVEMDAALESWKSETEALDLEPVEMTPEALESLRALGYLQ